jgi:hypothetical protein
MRGRDAIRAYWIAEVVEAQDDISFGSEILSVGGLRAFVHWWASYVSRKAVQALRLDGVFLLYFDGQGLCRSLQEWWHIDHAS